MTLDQPIYTDAVDPSMRIGGEEWQIIEARVELSKTSRPDFVDFQAIPGPETELPKDPPNKQSAGGLLGAEFILDVETEIDAERPESGESRIFTGRLANLSTAAEKSWEGVAYVPSHQVFASGTEFLESGSLYNTNITIKKAREDINYNKDIPDRYQFMYNIDELNKGVGYAILTDQLVKNISTEFNVPIRTRLKEGGYDIGGRSVGRNNLIRFSTNVVNAAEALSRAEIASNSMTWFDREGTFYFGAPRPDTDINKYNLQFITDTTAGIQTPPYQSVRVIGSGVVSATSGWESININPERKQIIEDLVDQPDAVLKELPEPTFVYRNMELTTYEQVEAAASKILTKIEEQSAKGKVTVVGMPEIRPYDGVVMPDSESQPMGGEVYGVKRVVHKLNGSDGFKTDIHVSSPTNVQRSVLSDEIEEDPENYTIGEDGLRETDLLVGEGGPNL